MMIRIESSVSVEIRNAILYSMHRNNRRIADFLTHAVTSAFESRTVAFLVERCWSIPVEERPAILYQNWSLAIYQVEAIVAVMPCSTASEHITYATFGLNVRTKAVNIASSSVLANLIVVVVSITIQYQII
jgi:hypothetical protein